jgi:hypothetical protein
MPLPKEFVPTLDWLLPCTGPYYRPALTRIMSTLEDTANTSCAGPYSGNALNLGPYPTEKHFRETEIKSKAM